MLDRIDLRHVHIASESFAIPGKQTGHLNERHSDLVQEIDCCRHVEFYEVLHYILHYKSGRFCTTWVDDTS